MEEVEHLCDRIGIISQGQLRCVGGITELKERFGRGYKLILSFPQVLRGEGKGVPEVVRRMRDEWTL
jgi:ABC-type multidrug transport system ATPase subunit